MFKKYIREFLIISIIGTLLSIIITWPFAANITTYYPDRGDYALAGSNLWYNQDAIRTGKIFDQQLYFQGYQFYPQLYSLAFSNNMVVPSLIFAPVFWITHSLPFSVNSYTLLTLVLSFVTAYYCLKYFVKVPMAAIIGAAIFAFNPQTMIRFPQHLDVLTKYFIPLVILFGYQFLERPTLKKGLLFFLTFSLNGLSVTYYFTFTALILPFAAIPFLLGNFFKENYSYFTKLLKYSLVGLIFLPILFYFNLPYLDFSQKEGSARSPEGAIFFSARILDWVTPAPDNLIYGNISKTLDHYRAPKDNRGILNYEEHTLFLNILPMVLFIIGWRLFRKGTFNKIYFYTILGLSFLFTFGPYFTGNGDTGLFQLPLYHLYQIFPLLQGIRAPTRFEFIFYVPFALIASFGVLKIMNKWKKYSLYITIIFLVLICLENITTKNFNEQSQLIKQATALNPQIRNLLTDKNVLHLPIYSISDADIFGKNAGYLNWLTVTGEKTMNGATAYLPPDQLQLLESFRTSLGEDEFKKLLMLGLDYVIIHKNLIPNYQQQYAAQEHFYALGKIYDQNNLLIIDLHKYNLDYQICDFSKDFSTELKQVVTDEDNMISGYGLVLKNNSSCYLPSILSDRYHELTVNIDGQAKTVSFRLPLIIGPVEQVVLTEINHEIKVE